MVLGKSRRRRASCATYSQLSCVHDVFALVVRRFFYPLSWTLNIRRHKLTGPGNVREGLVGLLPYRGFPRPFEKSAKPIGSAERAPGHRRKWAGVWDTR